MARSRKTPAPYETNPTDTRLRVSRGGGWDSLDPSRVRAAFRYGDAVSSRYSLLGFRCALRGREPRDPSKVGL